MPDQSTPPGTPVQVPFTIGDAQQGPNGLGFQLFTTNVGLTPTYQVLGTGAQRTLRVDTAAGMSGAATITLVVSDGTYQTASRFLLSVGAAGPPGPPSNFTASLTGTTLSLSWGAPATGAPATEYVLQVAVDPGFGNIVHTLATGSPQTSMTIPGVPSNVVFYLRLLARNGLGTSGPSNAQQVGGPPGAPSGFVATLQGSSLTLSWQAPTTGGAPNDYVLEVALDPGFGRVIFAGGVGPGRNLVFTGVPPGTFYLRVRARNASGISGPSNTQQIGGGGCTAPGAPVNFSITKLGGMAARLSWSPGGGGAPSNYVLQAALDAGFGTVIVNLPVGLATSLDATGAPGTYFVRVLSASACGQSAPSNTASVTFP